MRKKKVVVNGVCFGGYNPPEYGKVGGVFERHYDVEIHFESIYAWISFVCVSANGRPNEIGFNNASAVYYRGVFARSVVADGVRRNSAKQSGKHGRAVCYTVSPVTGVNPLAIERQGCRDLRNAKHNGGFRCENCGWSGPSLNLVPHQCERVEYVMKDGKNEAVHYKFSQHDLKYRAELVDEFGRLISQDDINGAVFWLNNERTRKAKERFAASLAREGWDVSEYQMGSRGDDCQPQNRRRLPHDRIGYYGDFLRKYPALKSYDSFYNYRRMRTTQECRMVAAVEHEEYAPKVRAKRNATSLPSAWDDICGTTQRSWKTSKKRKQWQ